MLVNPPSYQELHTMMSQQRDELKDVQFYIAENLIIENEVVWRKKLQSTFRDVNPLLSSTGKWRSKDGQLAAFNCNINDGMPTPAGESER